MATRKVPHDIEMIYRDVEHVEVFVREEVALLLSAKLNAAFDSDPVGNCEPFNTTYGQFMRALGWLHSVNSTRDPFHVQAHSAAARSMFEIAIDLALLAREPGSTPEKMFAWEESAKLDSARDLLSLRSDPEIAAMCRDARALIRGHGQRIERNRQYYWPPKPGKVRKHPARWTGGTLYEAAERADRVTRLGSFRKFYRLNNDRLCWGTHGSTLVLMRNVDSAGIAMISGIAVEQTLRFAILAARMAMEGCGLLSRSHRKVFGALRGMVRLKSLQAMLREIAAGNAK